MDNTFKISVEVGLREDTIQRIAAIFGGVQTRPMAAPSAPVLPPKPEVKEEPKPEAPKPEEPKPEAPKAEAISNIVLNNAVKDALGRGVPPETVREVFVKYGIEKSRDCAEGKRASLLADLNALK